MIQLRNHIADIADVPNGVDWSRAQSRSSVSLTAGLRRVYAGPQAAVVSASLALTWRLIFTARGESRSSRVLTR